MKIKLLKRVKIWHDAGETIEVSPAEADFLLAVKAAEEVAEKAKPARKKTTK